MAKLHLKDTSLETGEVVHWLVSGKNTIIYSFNVYIVAYPKCKQQQQQNKNMKRSKNRGEGH